MEKYRYLNAKDLINVRENCVARVNPSLKYKSRKLLTNEEKEVVINLLVKKLNLTYLQAEYLLFIENPKNLVQELLDIENIKDPIPSSIYILEGKMRKNIKFYLFLTLIIDFSIIGSSTIKEGVSKIDYIPGLLLILILTDLIIFSILFISHLFTFKGCINIRKRIIKSNKKTLISKVYGVKFIKELALSKYDKSSLIYGFKIKVKENNKYKYLIFSNLKYQRSLYRKNIKDIERSILNKINRNKEYEFVYYDKANFIDSSNINLEKIYIKIK